MKFKNHLGWIGAVAGAAALFGLATSANAVSPVVTYSPYQAGPVTAPGNGYPNPSMGGVNVTLPVTNLDGQVSGYVASVAYSVMGSGYVIGDTQTLTDGGVTHSVLTITHVQLYSATVAAGGSGGTTGATTCTGTTGTGTKFQVTGTIAGGAISGALVVSVAGDYTVMPTSLTVEPGSCTASLTGATFALSFGVKTATNTAGSGIVYPSTTILGGVTTTGAGTGATWTVTMTPAAQTLAIAPVNGYKVYNSMLTASHVLWVTDNGTTPVASGSSAQYVAVVSEIHTNPTESPPGSKLQILGYAVGDWFQARVW